MITGLRFFQRAMARVLRGGRAEATALLFRGEFHVRCIGADGQVKWEDTARNAVTNEGLNAILDVMFHATAQLTTWYIGLINNSPSPTLAAGDTLASHAGWSETTAYSSPAARGEWTEGAASSQQVTNASTVDFVANATVTVYGLFLASVASGTSGRLWATAAFSGGTKALTSGDTLQVTYTVSAAAA